MTCYNILYEKLQMDDAEQGYIPVGTLAHRIKADTISDAVKMATDPKTIEGLCRKHDCSALSCVELSRYSTLPSCG